MPDPITVSARAAAVRLSAIYGSDVEVDVEAALHPGLTRHSTAWAPRHYVDPVSVGGLIVSIATLAWTVYSDLRSREPAPAEESVTRAVRIELTKQGNTISETTEEITRIVVSEMVTRASRHAADS